MHSMQPNTPHDVDSISKGIILLSPQWLSTKENATADFLSRQNILLWEFRLSREIFTLVLDHFHLNPTLDVFASEKTHQLTKYMSWFPDPQAAAQNALLHKWDKVSYLFPPVPLIPKSLQKVMKEKIEVIMVVPHWPTALWWSLIQEMLVVPLLPLPNYKTILLRETNMDLPYLNPLVAVHLKA